MNEARERRAPFRFSMIDIPYGAEIIFSRDENVKAKVFDDRLIELNGERTSISSAAQKLLNVEWPAQGPLYWIYEGETLDERRQRIDIEKQNEIDDIDSSSSVL